MRTDRIVKRWNLKSRAKAGRFLQTWQQRLTDSAHRLYQAGYVDAQMEGLPASQANSDLQRAGHAEGGRPAHATHDGRGQLHPAVSQPTGLLESV